MSDSGEREEMDSDHQDVLSDYTLVHFIKRGRKSKVREIDIVPTKWLDFNKQKGRCTTKFPDASTNPEDNELLHDLVKALADAPEDWKEYTVDLKGRAKTYEEALEKFEHLKDHEYVLTTSENDPEKLVKKMEEDVKRRRLNKVMEILKTKLDFTEPDVDDDSDKSEDVNINTLSQTISFIEPQAASYLYDISEASTSTTQQCSNKVPIMSSEDEEGGVPPVMKKKLKKKNLEDPVSQSEGSVNPATTTTELFSIPVIHVPQVQCNSAFETAVLASLAILHNDMHTLKSGQAQTTNYLIDKEVVKVKKTDFQTKYNLVLPIDDKETFVLFNENLKSNKFLQSDVCLALKNCIDKDLVISKSYLVMLRTFISNNVAVRYTASRRSRDQENAKDQMKSMEFYKCMEPVMLSAREEKNILTTEKDLMSSLSDVLSNAKAWRKSKK